MISNWNFFLDVGTEESSTEYWLTHKEALSLPEGQALET